MAVGHGSSLLVWVAGGESVIQELGVVDLDVVVADAGDQSLGAVTAVLLSQVGRAWRDRPTPAVLAG
jgi:hypothetical protein